MSKIYIIDTSSWINMSKWYPFKNFPSLWNKIDLLIKDYRILMPKQVYDEIKQGNDDLSNWINTFKDKIIDEHSNDYNDMFKNAKSIMEKYEDLVPSSRRVVANTPEVADPYVIGLAKHRKTQSAIQEDDIIIISDDKQRKTSIKSVCNAEGIECYETTGLIIKESWHF